MHDLSSLAILILNYENYGLTIECVTKLISYNLNYNIVIIDNCSKNNSYNILKDKFSNHNNVFIIKTDRNGGYSYGNNFGIKFILNKIYKIDYICIMNPDVIIDYANIFSNLIVKIEDRNEIAGITAMSVTNGNLDFNAIGWKIPNTFNLININLLLFSKIKNTIAYKRLRMDNLEKSLGYIDVIPGSFYIMKRNKFEEVCFLDENVFLYYEENILGLKIKEINSKFVVSINDYYLHNHYSKNKNLLDLKSAINDYKITIKSQKYFVLNYLRKNYLIWLIISFSCYIHLYLEIPIRIFMKKYAIKVKK